MGRACLLTNNTRDELEKSVGNQVYGVSAGLDNSHLESYPSGCFQFTEVNVSLIIWEGCVSFSVEPNTTPPKDTSLLSPHLASVVVGA